MIMKKEKTVEKTEFERNQVLQTVIDDYQERAIKRIRPAYPYLLVRLLPRAHKVGSVFVPETAKKVLHEGVVLETFRPHWKLIQQLNGEGKRQEVLIKPPAEVGDHILFEWFEGVPVEHTLFQTAYVKSASYVLVAASPIGNGRNGVLAVIDDTFDVQASLEEALTSSTGDARETVAAILDKFLVTPKDQAAVTTSGANA